MEGQGLVLFLFAGVPVIGLVASFVVEIVLLKRTGWVDSKISLKYPLLVFLANIPVVIFFMFANFVALGILGASFVLMSPVATFIVAVPLTFLYAVPPFAARLAITKLMAGSSALTWKYVAVQALALAGVIVIALPIFSLLVILSS